MVNTNNFDNMVNYPRIPFECLTKIPNNALINKFEIYKCLGYRPSQVTGKIIVTEAISSVINRDDIRFYFFLSLGKVVVHKSKKAFHNRYELHDFKTISEFVWGIIKESGDFPYNYNKFKAIAFPYNIDLI